MLHRKSTDIPSYLKPYADAAARHGGGFRSLLWASAATQSARFEVFTRLCEFQKRTILDVGCGRADFLDFLLARDIVPKLYIGLEALEPLASAAESKSNRCCRVIRGDFVKNPGALSVGADVIVFSGSLNTLDSANFHATVHSAFAAAGSALLFNFLDSPMLAAADYLTWHRAAEVRRFVEMLSPDVQEISDYMEGDRTIAVRHSNR